MTSCPYNKQVGASVKKYLLGPLGGVVAEGLCVEIAMVDPLQHFYFLKPLGSWLYIMPWEVVASVVQMVKNLPAMQETRVWSLGREDPLEKGMAIHSSILAWRIPWTEELGRLQFMGSQRVGHNWATNTTTATILLAELFKILKDDAVKVLTQYARKSGKQQWPQD